jgi:hypothetical protein
MLGFYLWSYNISPRDLLTQLCFEGIRYEIKDQWAYWVFMSWICWDYCDWFGYAALGQEVLIRHRLREGNPNLIWRNDISKIANSDFGAAKVCDATDELRSSEDIIFPLHSIY